MTNLQRPFSFNQPGGRGRAKPRRTQFSSNIKGLCTTCGYAVQKVRKFTEEGVPIPLPILCPICRKLGLVGVIKDLPKELIPWKIIRPRGLQSENFSMRFACQLCRGYYKDFATFGALCNHSTHTPPDGWVCRFCCTHTVVPSKTANESSENSRKRRKKALKQVLIDQQPFEIPAWGLPEPRNFRIEQLRPFVFGNVEIPPMPAPPQPVEVVVEEVVEEAEFNPRDFEFDLGELDEY